MSLYSLNEEKESDMVASIIDSTVQMKETIKESTNSLIKAVEKTSTLNVRTNSKVMEDLAYANTLLESSLKTLKDKEKKLKDSMEDKMLLKEMLFSEINSVKIHKGNVKYHHMF